MKVEVLIGGAIVAGALLLGTVKRSDASSPMVPLPPRPKLPRRPYDPASRSFGLVGMRYGVPPNLLRAIAEQESSFNANAIGENRSKQTGKLLSTDWGMFQLNDFALRWLGMTPDDARDPEKAIVGAARWLVQLRSELNNRKRFSRANWAASYNTGSNLKPADKAAAYSKAVLARWAAFDKRFPA